MPRPIDTATLVRFAAILAALASVLGLLAADRTAAPPAARGGKAVERVSSLIAVQVESLARRY